MADPDLELRGGGGGGIDFLALLAFFPSVISSFVTQNRGSLDPPMLIGKTKFIDFRIQ